MSRRAKSYSVCDAEGNPISISLKPSSTSSANSSSFLATDIGCTRAWFPSRRSTLHQSGARSIVLSGQRRSVSRIG
jgi:hypothetical protein